MARLVSVAGVVTGIPDVYQNKIDIEGGSRPGVLESGVVCIVGPCEGSIEPKVPYLFRSPRNLKELLGDGELYDAARFAFKPSREEPQKVRGAASVIAVRANPAVQATRTLLSGTPTNLISLSSVIYGIKANQISVAVAAGTLGGPSKKVTVAKMGENDEVGDSLGFLPALLVRYNGNATSAVMSISRTELTTTLAGDQADGSVDLSVSFASYSTITKLVAYINAQTGYEAVAVTNKPNSYLCETLDFVTAVDIKTISGTVTTADSTTENVTTASGLVGLGGGDVLRVGTASYEYMYIKTTGTPNTAIRGYLDSNPATHTAQDAVVFYGALGVNLAIIEWVSTYSARLFATRHTDYATGVPANLAASYLTGGSEGAIGNSDWQDALDAIRKTKYNYIVITSTDYTPQSYLATHLNDKWGKLGQEAVGHVGIATDSTKAQIKTRAKLLQNPNINLYFADANREDADGVDTNYPPWSTAVMAAAIQAGSAIGTPLTGKSLDVTNLGYNSNIDLNDDAEDFVLWGVCVVGYDGEEYRIIRALSTWTNTDDQHLISPANRTALAWTVYKVRDWVRRRHLGAKALKGNASSIKSTARDALEDCRDIDESIVEGSKLVGGRKIVLPAFEDIVCTQSGNTARLNYKCIPADGTDFVLVDTTVQPYQDVS